MPNTADTCVRVCALAIAAVFFIGSPASADERGGPSVTVVNTPLPVVVTNQQTPVVGTPVAFTLTLFSNNTYQVPPAQRLVIEYISGYCSNQTTTYIFAQVFRATTGGVLNSYNLPLGYSSVSPVGLWQFGQLVKIYADSGTDVILPVLYNNAMCSVQFSGQLVPMP
jgi:hypothetical protein